MRFVAGGGAVTELLLAGALREGAERPGALWQRSIGKKLLAGRREVCCWPGRYGGASAERRRYGGAFAGRGAAKCGKEGGALRWGPCAWGTQRWGRWAGAESLKPPVGDSAWEPVLGNLRVGDPALGNKGVLGASGLYLNQLRGFCFVVPCQSSK